jgi:hypothetical protein
MRGPRALGSVRVRRFADGSYAVSVRDRETQRSTLIEGDARRARLVHVDGDAWTEVATAPLVVPSGVARTTVRVAADGDGTVRRHGLTEYPNGTRRADRLTLGGDAFERVSHWELPDGTAAQARWEPDGSRQLVELEAGGEPTRTLRNGPVGGGIAQFAVPAEGAISRRVIQHRDGSTTAREVITGPDGATGSIVTTVHPDRSAEQHIVTSELGSSSRTDYTIGATGSTEGHSSATIDTPDGVVSVDVSSRFDTGTSRHSEEVVITHIGTGAIETVRVGGDTSTGERSTATTARDGAGNESESRLDLHGDGSSTLTVVSRGAGGEVTIEETGFDADGRETGSATSGPPEARGEGERPSEGGSEGHAGDERPDDGERPHGEDGDGSLPSEEGSGDGLGPTGGGGADEILGRHLGLGAGGIRGAGLGGLLGGVLSGGVPTGPEPGELEIDIDTADLAAVVHHRLSADAATGGATSGVAILDTVLAAPLVTSADTTDGWGDVTNPAALAEAVQRIAGAAAGAVAQALI